MFSHQFPIISHHSPSPHFTFHVSHPFSSLLMSFCLVHHFIFLLFTSLHCPSLPLISHLVPLFTITSHHRPSQPISRTSCFSCVYCPCFFFPSSVPLFLHVLSQFPFLTLSISCLPLPSLLSSFSFFSLLLFLFSLFTFIFCLSSFT